MPDVYQYFESGAPVFRLDERHRLLAAMIEANAEHPDFADPTITPERIDRLCAAIRAKSGEINAIYSVAPRQLGRRRTVNVAPAYDLTPASAQRLLCEARYDQESLLTAVGVGIDSVHFGRMVAGRAFMLVAACALAGCGAAAADSESYACARALIQPQSTAFDIAQSLSALPLLHAGVAAALGGPVLNYLQDVVREGSCPLGCGIYSLVKRGIPHVVITIALARWQCPGYVSAAC